MGRLTPLIVALAGIACGPPAKDAPKEAPKPIRVTMVVILASTTDTTINPKLKTLAEEVQKRNKKFTGFTIAATLDKSIPIGEAHTFQLPERQSAKVTVTQGKDKDGRVELKVQLPGLDEVTYTCVCDKFFPQFTEYQLKTGETILVAILAKPCTGK